MSDQNTVTRIQAIALATLAARIWLVEGRKMLESDAFKDASPAMKELAKCLIVGAASLTACSIIKSIGESVEPTL